MKLSTFPRSLVTLIVAIAILNGLAHVFYWYYSIWWFDIPMHFMGGFWVGAVALWVLYSHTGALSLRKRLTVAMVAVLVVGVLWEVFEFGLGAIGNSVDTQQDLMFDIMGALTAVLIYDVKRVK